MEPSTIFTLFKVGKKIYIYFHTIVKEVEGARLEDELLKTYNQALESFSNNDGVKDYFKNKFSGNYKKLLKHLKHQQTNVDSEVLKFLEVWIQKMYDNPMTSGFLFDLKINLLIKNDKDIIDKIDIFNSKLDKLIDAYEKQFLDIDIHLPINKSFIKKIPEKYISRYVNTDNNVHSNSLFDFEDIEKKKTFFQYLMEVFEDDKERIILLYSEAQSGKTTEIYFTAKELLEKDFYRPIIYYLKDFNEKDSLIEELKIKEYQKYDLDFVVFLDGLDETTEAIRLDIMKQVNRIHLEYPEIIIIISCRSNFESSSFRIDNYTSLYLSPLKETEIDDYVKKTLSEEDADPLLHQIKEKNLYSLLRTPFYLQEVIKYFHKNEKQFPHNVGDLYDFLVKQSFDLDSRRNAFTENPNRVKEKGLFLLQQIAFILQYTALNEISYNALPDRIKEEIDYCRNFSVLKTTDKDDFMFEHNAFKEYLTANFLSLKTFDQVKSIICLNGYEKLKRSWFFVTTLLLQILEKDSTLYIHLKDWIERYDLILLFSIDQNSFTKPERFRFFTSLLNMYNDNGEYINPNVKQLLLRCYVNGENRDIFNFLVDRLEENSSYNSITNNIFFLLYDIKYPILTVEQKDRLETIIMNIVESNINDVEREYENLLSPFYNDNFKKQETIEWLYIQLKDTGHFFYINKLIELFVLNNRCDEYIDQIIEWNSTRGGRYDSPSLSNVLIALSSVKEKNNVLKVLDFVFLRQSFLDIKDESYLDLLTHLFDKVISFLPEEPELLSPVLDIIRSRPFSQLNPYNKILHEFLFDTGKLDCLYNYFTQQACMELEEGKDISPENSILGLLVDEKKFNDLLDSVNDRSDPRINLILESIPIWDIELNNLCWQKYNEKFPARGLTHLQKERLNESFFNSLFHPFIFRKEILQIVKKCRTLNSRQIHDYFYYSDEGYAIPELIKTYIFAFYKNDEGMDDLKLGKVIDDFIEHDFFVINTLWDNYHSGKNQVIDLIQKKWIEDKIHYYLDEKNPIINPRKQNKLVNYEYFWLKSFRSKEEFIKRLFHIAIYYQCNIIEKYVYQYIMMLGDSSFYKDEKMGFYLGEEPPRYTHNILFMYFKEKVGIDKLHDNFITSIQSNSITNSGYYEFLIEYIFYNNFSDCYSFILDDLIQIEKFKGNSRFIQGKIIEYGVKYNAFEFIDLLKETIFSFSFDIISHFISSMINQRNKFSYSYENMNQDYRPYFEESIDFERQTLEALYDKGVGKEDINRLVALLISLDSIKGLEICLDLISDDLHALDSESFYFNYKTTEALELLLALYEKTISISDGWISYENRLRKNINEIGVLSKENLDKVTAFYDKIIESEIYKTIHIREKEELIYHFYELESMQGNIDDAESILYSLL